MKNLFSAFVAALAICGAMRVADAAPVISETFNDADDFVPNDPNGFGLTGFTTQAGSRSWTVTNGNMDVVTDGQHGVPVMSPDPGLFVDTVGSNDSAVGGAVLESELINLAAGAYQLFFDYALNGSASRTLLVEVLDASNTAVASGSLTVTAANQAGFSTFVGSAFNWLGGDVRFRITGDSDKSTNTGALVDNLAIDVAAVPEPTSMALAALGCLGAFGAGVRRRVARKSTH